MAWITIKMANGYMVKSEKNWGVCLSNQMKLKCGACGIEGTEKDFEDEHGTQKCKWCDSDVWLNTLEEHTKNN